LEYHFSRQDQINAFVSKLKKEFFKTRLFFLLPRPPFRDTRSTRLIELTRSLRFL